MYNRNNTILTLAIKKSIVKKYVYHVDIIGYLSSLTQQ